MNLRAEREIGSSAYSKLFQKLDPTDTAYQNYLKVLSKHYFTVKNIIQVIMNDNNSVIYLFVIYSIIFIILYVWDVELAWKIVNIQNIFFSNLIL